MKKFCLSFIIYPFVCLCPLQSTGLNNVSVLKDSCVVAKLKDSLLHRSKSKLTLFIDHVWFDRDTSNKDHASISLDYFLVNNTADTLRYRGNRKMLAQSFLTGDNNVTIGENNWPDDTTRQLVILPHRGIYGWFLNFNVNNAPDTTFSIKVGVRLVKLTVNNGTTAVTNSADDKPDTVWSDTEEVKAGRKYKSHRLTHEEYQARALKRPLWAFFPKLTDDEKENYTLNINQAEIYKLKDTIINRPDIWEQKMVTQHYLFTKVPVTFTNRSNDTLKYINMDCSWEHIYKTNDSVIKVSDITICFKNGPTVLKVLPHQSFTVSVPVETNPNANRSRKIKIGMSIQKFVSGDQWFLFDTNEERLVSDPSLSNMIWSNEVDIR